MTWFFPHGETACLDILLSLGAWTWWIVWKKMKNGKRQQTIISLIYLLILFLQPTYFYSVPEWIYLDIMGLVRTARKIYSSPILWIQCLCIYIYFNRILWNPRVTHLIRVLKSLWVDKLVSLPIAAGTLYMGESGNFWMGLYYLLLHMIFSYAFWYKSEFGTLSWVLVSWILWDLLPGLYWKGNS